MRDALFAGRARERAELVADVRAGQNVVVISPRRYGKSSLVLAAIEDLRRAGILCAYVDLLSVTAYERLPDLLANAIYSGMAAPAANTRRRAVDLFGDMPLRPRIGYDPSEGEFSLEFVGGSRDRDVAHTIERLLALPAEIARQRGRRVALVLDEFQAVVDLDPRLPATMRAIFQQQTDVAHVFLGSQRHVLERLFTAENEPMFRMAKPLPLGPIPNEEFAPFIRGRFASTKSPIGDEALERVLTLTGGHPNDTQELCYFLWAAAQAQSVFPIPAATVDRALDRVLDAESARFMATWERLRGKQQRAVLAAIAAEPGVGLYTEQFRQQHRLGPANLVQKAIGRLLDLGLVEPLGGRDAAYRVADTFMPAWLRRAGMIH